MYCMEDRKIKYLCSSCKEVFEKKSRDCSKCGSIFSIVQIPASASLQFGKEAQITAAEIMKKKASGKPLSGFEFIGNLPKKFAMVIHGEPGSGKSYFAFQIADAIANSSRKKTYYVTSEEEIYNLDFQNKISYCETSEKLYFASVKNKKEFIDFVANNNVNIIVDSISDLGITAKELKPLRENVGIFIYILHVNKKGEHKGTTDLIHDPQLEIVVSEGIATTKKNRFGKSGQEYKIFKEE